MFNIGFRSTPFSRNGEKLLLGKLEGPGLNEDFWSPLTYWRKDQYEAQWREGIAALLEGRPSVLVVSMRDPQLEGFINLWLLYPKGNRVIIQNKMHKFEASGTPFIEQSIYSLIPPYKRHNKDGENLSEWEIPMVFFADFLRQ